MPGPGGSAIEISRKSAHQFLPFMCSAPSPQHEHFPSGPRAWAASLQACAGAGRPGPPAPAPGAALPAGRRPGPGARPTVQVTVLGFRRRVSRFCNRQIRNRTRTDLEPPPPRPGRIRVRVMMSRSVAPARNPAPAPRPPGPGAVARPTQSLSTTSRLL
jgi:hypothetical protein